MKRINKWMKQIRQWFFLFILLLGGVIFCRTTDYGEVLKKPYVEAAKWLETELSTWENLPLIGMIRAGLAGETMMEETADAAQGEETVSGGDPADTNLPENPEPVPEETASEEAPVVEEAPVIVEEENRKPVYQHVEDDYFADAVFIGDSRTVGLSKYGGMETATFYASTGLTIFKLFEAPVVPVPGEKTMLTVEEALGQRQFAKIYLMLGINEMGRGDLDGFIQTYGDAVAHLKELQPEATIYLQGIMKVSAKRDAKGDYINNAGILERNERIAQLADNRKTFYLDVNPLLCDENGNLIEEYSFDGVHLLGKYYVLWKDFLKDHAVVLD